MDRNTTADEKIKWAEKEIEDNFADFLRQCLRALASESKPCGLTVTRPLKRISEICDAHAGLKLTVGAIEKGLIHVKADPVLATEPGPTEELDALYVRAAKRGIQFLAERSCTDSAAKGRTSKRRQEFEDSIKKLGEYQASPRQKAAVAPMDKQAALRIAREIRKTSERKNK